MPSLRAFPPERGRPALDWESRVRFRGREPSVRCALAPAFPLERGRPALDWESRGRFRGQVALAPCVSLGARAPRPRLGIPRVGSEGKLPSLRDPLERGRPALDWESRIRFRGQVALAPAFPLERGRPALDWESRGRFRGQVALAPCVSLGARAPRPRLGIPRVGSEGRVPSLRRNQLRNYTLGVRASRPCLGNLASDFLDGFEHFSGQGFDGFTQFRSGRMPKGFKSLG